MKTNDSSDDRLVNGVIEQDENALAALYDRYAAAVKGVAYKVVRDADIADEIMQEVFWRVWKHASSFQSQRGTFSNWLFSITRNLALDHLRRANVRPSADKVMDAIERAEVQPATDVNVFEAAALAERRSHVRGALKALPLEQAEVIEMAFFQGLTRREIAAALDKPVGTIHTRARLGMQQLRKLLLLQGIER